MKKFLIGGGLAIAGFIGGLTYGVYHCKLAIKKMNEETIKEQARMASPYKCEPINMTDKYRDSI